MFQTTNQVIYLTVIVTILYLASIAVWTSDRWQSKDIMIAFWINECFMKSLYIPISNFSRGGSTSLLRSFRCFSLLGSWGVFHQRKIKKHGGLSDDRSESRRFHQAEWRAVHQLRQGYILWITLAIRQEFGRLIQQQLGIHQHHEA